MGDIHHVWNVVSIVSEQDWGGFMWEIGSLVCIVNLLMLLLLMFWWGLAIKVKEQRILVGSDFFQTWKLSSWKPYFCLITHSYSDKLVLRKIQYFIINIWCIGCAQIFNLTILLQPIPIPTHDEMLVVSVENVSNISKIWCNCLNYMNINWY